MWKARLWIDRSRIKIIEIKHWNVRWMALGEIPRRDHTIPNMDPTHGQNLCVVFLGPIRQLRCFELSLKIRDALHKVLNELFWKISKKMRRHIKSLKQETNSRIINIIYYQLELLYILVILRSLCHISLFPNFTYKHFQIPSVGFKIYNLAPSIKTINKTHHC